MFKLFDILMQKSTQKSRSATENSYVTHNLEKFLVWNSKLLCIAFNIFLQDLFKCLGIHPPQDKRNHLVKYKQ